MYFQILQNANGHWYWHLKAANNEIIANGETYYQKANAEHAVNLVKQCFNAPVYYA